MLYDNSIFLIFAETPHFVEKQDFIFKDQKDFIYGTTITGSWVNEVGEVVKSWRKVIVHCSVCLAGYYRCCCATRYGLRDVHLIFIKPDSAALGPIHDPKACKINYCHGASLLQGVQMGAGVFNSVG